MAVLPTQQASSMAVLPSQQTPTSIVEPTYELKQEFKGHVNSVIKPISLCCCLTLAGQVLLFFT